MKYKLLYTDSSQLTISQFKELQKIINNDSLSSIEKQVKSLSIFYDVPSKDTFYHMTPAEAAPYINRLNEIFASTRIFNDKPSNNSIPSKLSINGNKYKVVSKLSKLSVAQYVDYEMTIHEIVETSSNTSKPENQVLIDYLPKLLAIFIVPKGHKYGDGTYEIVQVEDEIEYSLTIGQAADIYFFLLRRSIDSMRNKIKSMKNRLQVMKWFAKKNPEKTRIITETMNTMNMMMNYLTELQRSTIG